MLQGNSTLGPTPFQPAAIVPPAPPTWPELVAAEPRLGDIERTIRQSFPPTDVIGFHRAWGRWKLRIAGLVEWASEEQRQLAVDHLFVTFDDRVDEIERRAKG